MSKVYRHRYATKNGDYETLFFEASMTPLSNIEYIDLPDKALRHKSYDYGFDKYPIGMPKTPELKMEVDLLALPDDTCRDLFVEPVRTLPLTIGGVNYGTFKTGTVFIVSVPGISEFFIGCLRKELSISVKIGGTLSCTLEHIARCVLDSTKYNLYATNVSVINPRNGVREVGIERDGVLWTLNSENHNFNLRFDSFNSTFDYPLFDIVNAAYKAIMRDSSRQFNTNFPKAKFYTQNQTSYQLPGDPLTLDDIKVIRQATSKPDSSGNGGNQIVGGVMVDLKDGAPDKYDCFWDFYSDIAEFFVSVAVLKPNGIYFQAPRGGYPGSDALEPLTISFNDVRTAEPEITMYTDILKTATGSVVERIDDGSGYSDQDKYEARSVASRNEGEFTVPVIFQTSPVCQKYDSVKNYPNDFIGKYPHIWGLYYYYSTGSGQAPAKVCHTVDYYLDAENTIPRDLVAIDPTSFRKNQGGDFTVSLQMVSGGHKFAADAILRLFGDPNQCMVEIEVPYSVGRYALERLGEMFEVNLTGSNGYIGSKLQAMSWGVVNTEFDFDKEIIKLKLLSRSVL